MPHSLTPTFRCFTLFLFAALAGCASVDKYSFETFGRPKQGPGSYDPSTGPVRSDLLALHYADYVAKLLEGRGTGARITREASDSALVVGGALAGAQETLGLAVGTVAHIGLGAVVIRELQGIFNARGRSEAFTDAAHLIRMAQAEFRAHNPNPSAGSMTQNGATLVRRVDASLYVARKTLTGRVPTVQDMLQATESMSASGARAASAGVAFNDIPALAASERSKAGLPVMTEPQPYNPKAKTAITTATPIDVQADQIVVSTWITEQDRAKNHALLRQFVRKCGEKPERAENAVRLQAREQVREATNRRRIDQLLSFKDLPLEPEAAAGQGATNADTPAITPNKERRDPPPMTLPQ